MGDNGFRDRAETAAMPHHNRSLHPGGIQGGMNLGRGVCATHRQRSATVLLSWESGTLSGSRGECNPAKAGVTSAHALVACCRGERLRCDLVQAITSPGAIEAGGAR
jgi:hypothetical protein